MVHTLRRGHLVCEQSQMSSIKLFEGLLWVVFSVIASSDQVCSAVLF